MEYGRKEIIQEKLVHERKKLEIMEKEYFDQKKLVEDMKKEIYVLEKEKKCPRCGKSMNGFPALSRKDNKTEICSQCGQEEAMEAFNIYYAIKVAANYE